MNGYIWYLIPKVSLEYFNRSRWLLDNARISDVNKLLFSIYLVFIFFTYIFKQLIAVNTIKLKFLLIFVVLGI